MKSPNELTTSCDDSRLYSIDIMGTKFNIAYESSDTIKRYCGDLGYTIDSEVMYGACVHEMELIFINSDMSYDKIRSTIFHEAMHALLDLHYGNMLAHVEEVSEEMIVCLLTAVSHKQADIYNQIYKGENNGK